MCLALQRGRYGVRIDQNLKATLYNRGLPFYICYLPIRFIIWAIRILGERDE